MINNENAKKFGALGEEKAAALLKKAGCVLLERNFKAKTGEIDIIAKHKETIIFAEVKARSSQAFGGPIMAVTKAKQQKIIKTALLYIQLNGLERFNMRFDVITFDGKTLEHLPGAFC